MKIFGNNFLQMLQVLKVPAEKWGDESYCFDCKDICNSDKVFCYGDEFNLLWRWSS